MPPSPAAGPPQSTWHDFALCVALYVAALAVFWYSPVTVASDSRYTLLLTHNLLSKGSFTLGGYNLPHPAGPTGHDSKNYQIESVHGHLYYYFPPGSSILSAPFVLAQDALGLSVVRPDGSFSAEQEENDQHFIAAALMAALTVTFYLTARLVLPAGWSLGIALGGALGTQVWSTASRGLWNHTWGIALLGSAVYLLLAHETGKRRLPPVLLATLLSWTYFVRPTNSLFIIGITLYLLVFHRQGFLRYALTGAAWFAAFVGYSWSQFGKSLPSYFSAARLETTTLPEALAGNLISPSRGLLLFVPVVLFVWYLPLRYRHHCQHARLLVLAAGVSVGHYAAVSSFVPWYGGGCYGPRYTTELVPWLVLVAALGMQAALRWREDDSIRHPLPAWRATLAAGAALLLLSIVVNGRGATDPNVKSWNMYPVNVDVQPARVWDWRYPQVLAGFLSPPAPDVFPVAVSGQRISFGDDRGRPFQLAGWRWSDREWCWSAEHQATLIFAVEGPAPRSLRLRFQPYIHPPQLLRQHVTIRLNAHLVAELNADAPAPQDYTLPLPAGACQPKNVLTFDLPDATAPKAVDDGPDERSLGIALSWIELDATPDVVGQSH